MISPALRIDTAGTSRCAGTERMLCREEAGSWRSSGDGGGPGRNCSPGSAERRYRLEIGALTGPDAIDAFARGAAALAAETQIPT